MLELYTGYPGSGERPTSPGFIMASGRWLSVSFVPWAGRISVSGSNRTPNRFSKNAAIESRSRASPRSRAY